MTLRLGAAVAEIEALYAAMITTDDPRRERQLRRQLARAARNLAGIAGAGAPAIPARRRPMSRRAKRAAVARGAARTLSRVAARR